MTVDPRAACIVGVAQETFRGGHAPEPLDMWEQVARTAAADTGRPAVLDRVDAVTVVFCQSWQYDDPARRLADRLQAPATRCTTSGVGGTSPQVAVHAAAAAIAGGHSDVVLVAGGEALATVRALGKAGGQPRWSDPATDPPDFGADPFHPGEAANELYRAPLAFALFETARRARTGEDPSMHALRLGRLLARHTSVAAANPLAWFPVERTAQELVTPTPTNRMAAYPYTKLMTAFMDVDMAAALVVTSHEAADRLGIAPERRVYLRGSCLAGDAPFVAERADLWRSDAMARAMAGALDGAGAGVDDLAHLDLYSCFSSAVELGLDALGLGDGDPRVPTVTGGLPYFGGPASNYMTHSIATMVGRLREEPGSLGLVSGIGMLMTKHAAGVYSTHPGGAFVARDAAAQAAADAVPRRAVHRSYTGDATVAAYSVWHGRDGAPEWGVAVCDTSDGGRCYTRLLDRDLLVYAEEAELVGATVAVVASEGDLNVVKG